MMLAKETQGFMELDEAIGLLAAALHVDQMPQLINELHEWKVRGGPISEEQFAQIYEANYEFWRAVRREALALYYICPRTKQYVRLDPAVVRQETDRLATQARAQGMTAMATWLEGDGRFSLDKFQAVRQEERSAGWLVKEPVPSSWRLFVWWPAFEEWMSPQYMEASRYPEVIGQCDETKLQELGFGDVVRLCRLQREPQASAANCGITPSTQSSEMLDREARDDHSSTVTEPPTPISRSDEKHGHCDASSPAQIDHTTLAQEAPILEDEDRARHDSTVVKEGGSASTPSVPTQRPTREQLRAMKRIAAARPNMEIYRCVVEILIEDPTRDYASIAWCLRRRGVTVEKDAVSMGTGESRERVPMESFKRQVRIYRRRVKKLWANTGIDPERCG